jgi:hypothetical protein
MLLLSTQDSLMLGNGAPYAAFLIPSVIASEQIKLGACSSKT